MLIEIYPCSLGYGTPKVQFMAIVLQNRSEESQDTHGVSCLKLL